MRLIDRLKREARVAAGWRGHTLGPFHSVSIHNIAKQAAECSACGMQVVVNTSPLPNEIQLGGEAVALGCRES